MRIGILQTGEAPAELRPDHGDYDSMCAALLPGEGFTTKTWRVFDQAIPADPGEADGWLITGSRFGAYEDWPWIPPLEDFIRAADDARVPMVGICFGHQIIAQALGGKVEKFAGGWSVGRKDYRLEGHDAPLHLLAWHQDQVVEPPTRARTFARSDFCAHAGLRYGDHIVTLQPHPEFSLAFLKDLLAARGDILPPDIRERGGSSLEGELSRNEISVMLAEQLAGKKAEAS